MSEPTLDERAALDETRDPNLRSWILSANAPDTHFPIQNLPFGVFSSTPNPNPRLGVAIGDMIVDLSGLHRAGLLHGSGAIFAQPSLNALLKLGRPAWRALRIELSRLLRADCSVLRDAASSPQVLVPQRLAAMHLPIEVRSFTDFFSSKDHALNAGRIFRGPNAELPPNWSELPIAYNGRASSVVVSGAVIRRPWGQVRSEGQPRPIFMASAGLDFELEVGFIVGTGTALGESIPCADAERHIFGLVLLNDWSARDLQRWESAPLGPFNAKGFATTISPWVVALDALEPFRCAPPPQDPIPLHYLRADQPGGFAIALEARLRPRGSPQSTVVARTDYRHMYWTMAQQLAHHTVSGCSMNAGDLCGSGTISGPTSPSAGCLLERTLNGAQPLLLDTGETRAYLHDGDELTLTGWCQAAGYRVGFGDCAGQVGPATEMAKEAVDGTI